MTQQYLKGELSLRLSEACDDPVCGVAPAVAPALADLRRRVEDAPLTALPALAFEAVEVLEAACWTSLANGDMAAFEGECRKGAQLHEFATCAGLLP